MNARVYPLPQPESGEDPRFCFGLAYDVAKVLEAYGYPPVTSSTDFVDLMQALFVFIYASDERPVLPGASPDLRALAQRAELHLDLPDDVLAGLALHSVHTEAAR